VGLVTMRIGLSVASDSIRAVGVRAARIDWAIHAERSPDTDLAEQIVKLVRRAKLPTWPRPIVMAAIGPSASQTKLLTGLPAITDLNALHAIVRENVPRFFLRNGIPLVMGGVQMEAPGSLWATALEVPVVRNIESACSTLGFRIRLIATSLVALTCSLEAQRVEWRDGDVRTEITIDNRRLSATRHLPEPSEREHNVISEPLLVPALRSLGVDAWHYADAYGATQIPEEEPLALRSGSGELDVHATRREVRIAAIALAMSVAAAIVAPVAAFAVRSSHTSRALATIALRAREAERAEVDLWRMSEALSEVAAFDRTRHSRTQFLAQLTRALPNGSVLVTARVDSLGGAVVLLTPYAASTLASLDSVAGIAAPQIIGPVTKEVVGSRELERATVQFRFSQSQVSTK
jgi:hypothetical protein